MKVPMIFVVVLAIYLVTMFIVGLRASKNVKNTYDFLLAGRSLGMTVMIATLCATQLGGGNIIGTSGSAYEVGISGATFGVGTGIAMICLGVFAAEHMRELAITTISDYVMKRYNSKVSFYLTSILSSIALIGILAAQVAAIAGVFTVFGINKTMGAVVAMVMIIIYTAASGMFGVAYTDVIQIIVVFIGLPLTTIVGLSKVGGFGGLKEALVAVDLGANAGTYFSPTGIGIPAMLGLILPMIAYELIGQDFYQRLLSAKTPKIAKKSAIIAGIILILFGINSAIAGMLGKALLGHNVEPSGVLASLAVEVLPHFIGAILISALVAAVMSTADSILLASTSHVINDIYLNLLHGDNESEKNILKISKVCTLCIGAVAVLIAVLAPGIISILTYSYTIYTSGLVVPIIGGIYWGKATKEGCLAAMVTGGIVGILSVFKIIVIGQIPAIINGIVISLIVFVAVSKATYKGEEK